MATATRNPGTNGRRPSMSDPPIKIEASQEALAAAAEYEAQIETEARQVWIEACGDGDAVGEVLLTPALFRKLRPLLRRPIPDGYISEVTFGKGKPYPSKGIKSLQVQIDRMDNVLGETNWAWTTKYLNDQGTLAEVEVRVLGPDDKPIISRRARGGVDRGSSAGNTHKGTETNAAKLAFARLGVGHEVYIGLTDLDPDVSEEAAQAAAESGNGPAEQKAATVTGEQAENLRKAVEVADLSKHLPTKLRAFGVKEISELTVAQGLELWQWAQGEGS